MKGNIIVVSMMVIIIIIFGFVVVLKEQKDHICDVCEDSNFTKHISYKESEIEVYCEKWIDDCKVGENGKRGNTEPS